MTTINGTNGPDTLPGTSTPDDIYGLGGNDIINGFGGEDVLFGGDGADYLNHNTSTDYLLDDFFYDYLDGGAGNDVIDIGAFDIAYGGAGIDRVTFYGTQSYFTASGVNWDLTGVTDVNSWLNNIFAGFVTVYEFEQLGLVGANFNDVMIGNDLDAGLPMTMEGYGGNDRLEGRGGRDELYGGDGDDILRGDDGDDIVDGGAGNDDIQGGNGFDLFITRITGGDPLAVTVDLTIATAQDTGNGNDTIVGVEHLRGIAESANQSFHFLGDAGFNNLTGSLGADTLEGRDGNDSLRGGAGGDSLIGGNGLDELSYFGSDAGVTINLTALTASGGHATGDTFSSIENVNATEFNDSLTGDGLANRFVGNGGVDTLNGLAGNDLLIGGFGSDVLNGGDDHDQIWNNSQAENGFDAAVDTIDGGGGNDTIFVGEGDIASGGLGSDAAVASFYGRGSGIVLDMSAGAEAAIEAMGGFQLSGFELFAVVGTAHADHITGSAVGEEITGGEGDDTILGGGGFDTLIGGFGDDTLDGGFANDLLRGGFGNDIYVLDDVSDAVQEFLDQGVDEVRTALASHTLAVNVETLTFTTAANHTGVGNAIANTLNGNDGDDTLTGAGGDDVVNGGLGSDTAVFAGNRALWTVSYLDDGVHVSNGVEDNVLTGVEFLAFADMTIPAATPNVINGSGDSDNLAGDPVTPNVDIIHGLGGDDVISGHGGDDALYGDDGADILSGGHGDDHIEGGGDDDNLYGEDGNDVLIAGGGSFHQLNGGEGNDVLVGGSGVNYLNGGAGADYLDGSAGSYDIAAYYGPAVVLDLDGNTDTGDAVGDVLVGIEAFSMGEGNDVVIGSTTASGYIELNMSGGDDILHGGTRDENCYGGDGADHLMGNDGADFLQGAGGDDHLEGGEGADRFIDDDGHTIMDGGNGDDTILIQGGQGLLTLDLRLTTEQQMSADAWVTLTSVEGLYIQTGRAAHVTGTDAANQFYGGGLDDVLIGLAGNDAMYGGSGADNLSGGDDADSLNGQGGDDILSGGDGADAMDGGEGADSLDGGLGSDNLGGGAGDDSLSGGGDTDSLYGGGGADSLDGGLGADYLDGNGDDDILRGGGGADEIYGGDGVDTADFSLAAGGVTAILAANAISNDGDGSSDTIYQVENLIGSAFADNLSGDEWANRLTGGAGADVLYGADGDDVLRGGAGADVLSGGGGIDTADYSLAAAGMRAQLNSNASSNDGDGGSDIFTEIENLTGSAFNDTLIGDNNVNVLRGGLGSDTLLGLGGNDVLWGGAGALNALTGGLGNDTYVLEAADSVIENAGEGTDTVDARINTYVLSNVNVENLIFGGTGNFAGTGNAAANVITGGGGDDVLRGRGGIDVLNGGNGVDTADYTLAAAGVTARIDLQRATNDGDGATDTYTNIENLIGSNFNDTLIGGTGANLLQGGIGTDTLLGFGGNDILMGGSGAANQLQGGDGDDRYILDAFDTCVEVAGQGIDTVEARVGSYTLGANIENLIYTGPGGFVGTGNVLNNIITGGTKADILRGGGGNDSIYGGGGQDELQLRGVSANYTITAEGAGYRIVDSVAGRDGSTYVESMEVVRFSNNTYRVLTYPPPAPAPQEAGDKGGDLSQVLPSIHDDGFVLPAIVDDQPLVLPGAEAFKFADEPLVLPGAEDAASLFLALEARLETPGWALTLDAGTGEPAHRFDDWMN
ncbi:Ca2+-binding RTX toxin-like protein [Brevundimonas alba]|uniref:Ca2+-binding RTX toxin-like protein n=1 Tax=Brevundimonas alba TaxID=74314 RepID=A0A7X5YKH5_9CAUL|nr:calcium-binding protein [Brevundimonas alba]NJC41339.1 Ca2+-binding RTX toxin-like protein [Brevundimonas alba]